jgi:hypothetical protein
MSLFSTIETYGSSFQLDRNQLKVIEPAQAGTITVTGYCWYYYNETLRLPITRARVEIYDNETTGIDFLGWNYTDYNGYFTFGPISNNDGPGEDGLDIIVIVMATSSAARVITPTGGIYAAQSPTFWNCSDGPFFRHFITPYAQRGAWWIFSYHFGLTRGWYYLSNTVGYNTPQVTARWPYETRPHYHPGGEIHLPDWACWWPDMILHEYGHHVMYSLYGYIPATMENHTIQKISNSTTAWAEGWADFFPLAVFNNPVFTWANATHYADINLEAPTWCWSQYGWDEGDKVEGRVAGALWDIFDPTPDGYDTFSDGFTHIWHLLSTQTDNTFKEFWQEWTAHNESGTPGYPKQPALMAIFQNSIDYRGPGDVNADGKVDIKDILLITKHYGNSKQNPTYPWDDRRDLNHDDKVDIEDVLIAQKNYGKNYDC